MKTLCALVLFSILSVATIAQRAQNNTDEQLRKRNAPDVFVYSASAFGPDEKGDSHFTIEVGNTGAKTIAAIEWQYSAAPDVADPGRRTTTTFKNVKLKLLPDQKIKVTQQVHHYTDKFVASFNLSSLRITRVEYDDGSFWQRPSDDR